jgi:hypothetical protein
MVLHGTLLVSLKRAWWVEAHRLGMRLFGATMWKLLIIELSSQWKLNKIKTENCIGTWGAFVVLVESPRWARFNRVYFTIFLAKVWKILIFEWILLLKIQTNCKNWVWKEKSIDPKERPLQVGFIVYFERYLWGKNKILNF